MLLALEAKHMIQRSAQLLGVMYLQVDRLVVKSDRRCPLLRHEKRIDGLVHVVLMIRLMMRVTWSLLEVYRRQVALDHLLSESLRGRTSATSIC